jgi:predicted nucleic acid-binding protein
LIGVRICFDTNIILDVLLQRSPHAAAANRLLAALEKGKLEGVLCATSLTTASYFVDKAYGSERVHQDMRDLHQLFHVSPVNRSVLEKSVEAGFDDFEDAVLQEAARQARADGIVTRNVDDFASATLTIYTPDELLEALRQR